MCIIVLAYKVLSEYPLILLENRDEKYSRPTQPLFNWETSSEMVAGKDEVQGGTWLGYNKYQQWAALTNYRNPSLHQKNTRSRGLILTDYLSKKQSGESFCEQLLANRHDYNHFNLLLGDRRNLYYVSSFLNECKVLTPGFYSLSNAHLDSPWPKTTLAKKQFKDALHEGLNEETLWPIMQNSSLFDDEELPSTGIKQELEKMLSAIFIETELYGTRATYLLTQNQQQQFCLQEKIY